MSYKELKISQKLVKTPYEKLIAACLVSRDAADLEAIDSLYKQCQERRLYLFAEEHECASIVAARLQALSKSSPQWDYALDDWKYRLNQRFEALDALADALKQKGIPLIALKNAGIARGIYPYPEECPMGDFDVLVKKSDFEAAHEVVMSQGFSLGFRAENTIEKEGVKEGLLSGGTEYKKELADDTLWLELQWRPIAGRWIAPEVEPKADDLFETAMPIKGSNILLQDPVSNLLQVSLHTAKHSYVRAPGLRLHTDVDRIVRAYPKLDWDAFVCRVKRMNVGVSVFFSLAIPADLFGTPIPEEVIDALEPPRLQRDFIFKCIEKAGLFHPLAHKFSRVRYLAFCAMLFDTPKACFHSAFPSANYMKAHYGLASNAQLPACYAKRFAGLLFKRVKT
ncbi:MAG: nucleotidyltransferase family protein [Proteobacteria bacterium]|nr:nucleotidyltransferase family protein [Pseudomonadota bacterium]